MRSLLFNFIYFCVSKAPRTVAIVCIGLAALAGGYGAMEMELIADQDKLLSEELPYHARYMKFIERFGDLEFLYVLIEGGEADDKIEFADELANRLERSKHIQKVIYKLDTAWTRDYALLYASGDELAQLRDELIANQSDIETLRNYQSVDSILMAIDQSLREHSASSDTAMTVDELEELTPLLAAMRGEYESDFAAFYELEETIEQETGQTEYFWSDNGNDLLMLIMPAKDFSTLSVIEAPLERIRTDLNLTLMDHPHITAGLTGRPALQADEMSTTNEDMKTASVVALIGVTLLFMLFFREMLRPIITMIALLCAMGWTFGFVALTLGHLNLLSSVFALILIGLGVDFGIHFLHRYQEELKRMGNPVSAIVGSLNRAGRGILTGAVTSSVAFLLALFTDFQGLAELGFVAGFGILFCLVAMLVALPSFLVSFDQHMRFKSHIPEPVHLDALRYSSRKPVVLFVLILAITLIAFPMATQVRFDDNLLELQAKGLESVEYEHKLIDSSEYSTWYCAFITDDLDSTRQLVQQLEDEPLVAKVDSLIDVLPETNSEKLLILDDIQSLLSEDFRYRENYHPSTIVYQGLRQRLQSMFDQMAMAREQMAQLNEAQAQLNQMAEQMANAQAGDRQPGANQFRVNQSMTQSGEIPSQLSPEQLAQMSPEDRARWQAFQAQQSQGGGVEMPSDAAGSSEADPRQALETQRQQLQEQKQLLQQHLDAMPSEAELAPLRELLNLLSGDRVAERLIQAHNELIAKPKHALQTIRTYAANDSVDLADLPQTFHDLYISDAGDAFLVMAFPRDNIWEQEPLIKFVETMRAIDPEVTGTPIQILESGIVMRESFRTIGIYSVLAVAFFVLLDFRKLSALILIMVPLLTGVLWLVQIMGTLDVHLNMANFFAIPILIGIGVDNAVHLFHRYEETNDIEQAIATTGTTLTLTSLTTGVGFGSLMLASHQGLASLGQLMAIGTFTCWFSCVVFLPILVKLFLKVQVKVAGANE